jgi:hypothetical protein
MKTNDRMIKILKNPNLWSSLPWEKNGVASWKGWQNMRLN